jgi:type IV pilus assembly protein PilB
MKRKKLGEILQDRGKISAANLQKLFEEQQGKMVRPGELILERGLVDKASLVKAIEEVSRVPYLDCAAVQCDQKALQSVPRAMAMRLVACRALGSAWSLSGCRRRRFERSNKN